MLTKQGNPYITISKNALVFSIGLSISSVFSQAYAGSTASSSIVNAKTQFSQQYERYKGHVGSEMSEDALAVEVSKLLPLAQTVYGQYHQNTINLTVSAANHYRNAKDKENALSMYDKALGLYEDADNSTVDHLNYAGLIIEVLSTNWLEPKDEYRLTKTLYSIFVDHTESTQKSQNELVTSLMLFNALLEHGAYSRGLSRLQSVAKEIIAQANNELPKGAKVLLRAKYNYGRLAEAKNKRNEAIEYFESIVGVTKEIMAVDHPYALASHARLVPLFERKGESTKATEHCIAIGRMKPWADNIEPTPLYRVNPKYPEQYARSGREGSVIMSFDISAFGFVENVEVIDTDGSQFSISGKKALEKWRYAPKFENGVAVAATDLTVRLDFLLSKRSAKTLKNS